MILTASTIQQAVGCSAAVAAQWAQPLSEACTAFGISTPKRAAAFLAQVGHESGSLTRIIENLNYGAQGMADTWPSRYAVDPKAKPRKPNDLARALERKPVAIGNNAYANRLGNGSEASGDGYRFRGRGPIQNTGRANYAAIRTRCVPRESRAFPTSRPSPRRWSSRSGAHWRPVLSGMLDP
ncbi:glycoside hydrolase family 19 protein [Stenotrophomonas sp. CD2]|nr:glycoside hydrolase family 19 protein [Stenotrophomonas sp. CD2]